jgi:hypothetical protein
MNSMSRANKGKTRIVLATDKEGKEIFVQLRASGIDPLVAMIDCLPLTFFGKGKTPYLRVQTALEWFEKEIQYGVEVEKKQMAITAYRRILEHFAAGKIVWE